MVKAMRVPDGQRLSNARLKPKGDVAGAIPDSITNSFMAQLACPAWLTESKRLHDERAL